jgi:protein-tyrosine phosphatase
MASIFMRYGGKRGFIDHCKNKTKYYLGGFRQYQQIDFSRVERLIFVCKGNICRSPYAEAIARKYCDHLLTASFGLHAEPGKLANEQALKSANYRGVDLRKHRTRMATDLVVNQSDLLIAMEPGQAQSLQHYQKTHGAQVTLLGLWGEVVLPKIADPYGHDGMVFDMCFLRIDAAIQSLCSRMRAIVTR